MSLKKTVFYFSKLTLIDEIVGFIYWALAVYGIFVITDYIDNRAAAIVALAAYIVAAAVFYIFLAKKTKLYFKGAPE